MTKLEFSISGPFQAYAKANARTFMDYKPTELAPQPSQIIGMIGAGLGIKREAEPLSSEGGGDSGYTLESIAEVIDIEVKISEKMPKIYHDYQVVNPKGTDFGTKKFYRTTDKDGKSKYVTALEYYKVPIRPEDKSNLPTAGGSNPPESRSKIIQKDYVLDSEFNIVITGEKEVLEKVRNALLHPYYPITLGRRNCIPSRIKVGEILEIS